MCARESQRLYLKWSLTPGFIVSSKFITTDCLHAMGDSHIVFSSGMGYLGLVNGWRWTSEAVLSG